MYENKAGFSVIIYFHGGLGFDLGREEPSYSWKAVTFTYETDSLRFLFSHSVTTTITITKAAPGAWGDNMSLTEVRAGTQTGT